MLIPAYTDTDVADRLRSLGRVHRRCDDISRALRLLSSAFYANLVHVHPAYEHRGTGHAPCRQTRRAAHSGD
jgi:hypothetical protein